MSKIEVNEVDVKCGSTLTLGSSGKTVKIATGASTCGMGRTGTVDWCTTAKTSPFTATSGNGYFVNTCGGAITVTLPASPTAGDIVSLKDYKDTWATACKSVTLGRNSSKIFGQCLDATLKTSGQSISLIYVDATQGWLNTQTDTTVVGNLYICASGGNAIVTCGDYKTHIFTGDGTFTVSTESPVGANNVVEYVVVAGGGGGGGGGSPAYMAGGGGAGGTGTPSPHPNTGGPGGVGSYLPDGFIGTTAPSYGTPGPVSSTRYFAGGGGSGVCSGQPGPSGSGGAGGGAKNINITTMRVPYKFSDTFDVDLDAGDIVVPTISHSDSGGTRTFVGTITLKFVTR